MKPDKNSELIVHGVGVCAAVPDDKNPPLVFCAYARSLSEPDVGFVATEFPVKKPLERDDILSAIARAENVSRVTYIDYASRPKDIFVCREQEGKISDIVERTRRNEFVDGFAEIAAGRVRFGIAGDVAKIKPYTALSFDVGTVNAQKYGQGRYEYAIVNAFNACLLGRLFSSHPEFELETKDCRRVRIEVRLTVSETDGSRLYVKPDVVDSDGYESAYLTEEFNFVDGASVVRRQYKIVYTNRLNDYYISRV